MRTFDCSCGETLFFDNTRCMSCGTDAGFCPVCQKLVPLVGSDDTGLRCGNTACGAALVKCNNYRYERVCNRCIAVPEGGGAAEPLCSCCRYNAVIPDLSKEDNRNKWRRLEAAKRRMFYQLDLLRLPRGTAAEGYDPPLSFEFKEDPVPLWSGQTYDNNELLGDQEVVMTGHLNGKITINLREADPVERERLRVHFGERHRSLIGHFRHEMAHYYWDLLVRGKREPGFVAVFGDPHSPSYSDALQAYYQRGPAPQWAQHFASAYASMHPWEDFAETFAAYLEMVAILDTAHHMGMLGAHDLVIEPGTDHGRMVSAYAYVGTALNELNRTMGLKDVLTRPLTKPVVKKMRFIHDLIGSLREPEAIGEPSPRAC